MAQALASHQLAWSPYERLAGLAKFQLSTMVEKGVYDASLEAEAQFCTSTIVLDINKTAAMLCITP